MRVCMLGYTFYETDSRVRQYAQALVERGDEVDFIGLRQTARPNEESVDGVRVFRLQNREFDETGKATYLFKLLRFLARSSMLMSVRHLRNRYDLIHIHSVPDFLVFAAWLPKLTGAKVILDIHDVIPEFYGTKFNAPPGSVSFQSLLLLEKLCAAFSDHVIIANDIWREKLISRSLTASKCTTILNSPRRIRSPQLKPRQPKAKFVILYPGSLNHHQGVDVAVRAFALIEKSIPELEFHIYGDGAERENIRVLIEQFGLERRIFLRPYVEHEEVLRIMEKADLGVDPKRSDSFANEAFGGKIFEFMALGVPTIISGTNANKYYFNETVTQFCRSDDAEDLARAIQRLYHNAEARDQLTKNASQFVLEYGWEVRKSIYLDLVDSLTQGSRQMRVPRFEAFH